MYSNSRNSRPSGQAVLSLITLVAIVAASAGMLLRSSDGGAHAVLQDGARMEGLDALAPPDPAEHVAVKVRPVGFSYAGRLLQGTTEALHDIDASEMEIQNVTPIQPATPDIGLEVNGTVPEDKRDEKRLVFMFTGRNTAWPAAVQRISFYDFQLNSFRLMDERPSKTGDTSITVEAGALGAAPFINQQDGKVRAEIAWFDPGNLFAADWRAYIDMAVWEVGPQKEPRCEACDPECVDGCEGRDVTGDPVYLFSGEYTLTEHDLSIDTGRGPAFSLGRTYRSQYGPTTFQGVNWDNSYNIWIGAYGDDLLFHDGRGRTDLFNLQEDGTWTRREYFRVIERDPYTAGYRMIHADTSVWFFADLDNSPHAGKILSMADRNGNAMRFEYDGQGRLVTVLDPLERPIEFAYNGDGFLETVTDFTGREVRYEYYQHEDDAGGSFGDLKSVTSPAVTGTPKGNNFPDGKTRVYTYSRGLQDEELNHNLLSIRDGREQVFLTNIYAVTEDPADLLYDRCVQQVYGGGVYFYTYLRQTPVEADGYATQKTIINNRAGFVKELFFNPLNHLVCRRDFTGRADPTSPTTEDFNRPGPPLRDGDPEFYETKIVANFDSRTTHRLDGAKSAIDNEFDSTSEHPRSRGNLLKRTTTAGPLVGDQMQIVETFEYDTGFGGCCGSNFVTRYVDGEGHATVHEYDDFGNRVRTTYPLGFVEEWEYNPFGQMISHVLPGNGPPDNHRRQDEYTYYDTGPQEGYLHERIVDAGGFHLITAYEYDSVGNIIRTIDPCGHDTLYVYNQLDQVVQERSAEVTLPNAPVRYERDTFYDENDNVVRVDVRNFDDQGDLLPNESLTTMYDYDVLDQLIRSEEEVDEGHTIVTEREYDLNKNLLLVSFGEATNGNQPDNVVKTIYDERDLLFLEIRGPDAPECSTTRFDYDLNGNLVRRHEAIEDGPHVWTSTFDGYGRLTVALDPMGNETTYHYDANGNRVSELTMGQLVDIPGGAGNVRLRENTYQYDPLNRLIREDIAFFDTDTQSDIEDGWSTTLTEWSDNSQIVRVEDDRGNASLTSYDTANRVAIMTDAKGNETEYGYNCDSLVVAVTERERSDLGSPDEVFVTTNGFDAVHRLVATTDNIGSSNGFGYDSRDNRTLLTDALNHETRYLYDGMDRLIKTVRDLDGGGANVNAVPGDGDPDIVTAQAWDDSSRLVEQTDDNANTTNYEYDPLNRLIKETYADCTERTFEYDAHDVRVMTTDANGSRVDASYDGLDRLIGNRITRGPGVVGTTFEDYSYDGLSRLVSAIDDDSTVLRSYDSLSRVTQESLNGAVTESVYDGKGNQSQCTYPGGRVIDCIFDVLDRPMEITDQNGPIATYAYIGPGRVERREYGNGTTSDYAYDGVRNIVRTRHALGMVVIDEREYTWDAMHNKTSRRDVRTGAPGFTHAYAYDDAYRLVHTTVTNPGNVIVCEREYTLDGVHNRRHVDGCTDPGPYVMEGPDCVAPGDFTMNQYTQTPFDRRTYDENGNLIGLVDPQDPPPMADVMYDYRNQMVTYLDPSTDIYAEYEYDPLGRRITRTVNAETTRYLYDDWRVCEERDVLGVTMGTYVYGLYIDEVLTMQRGGSAYYYHTDDLYNVMAISDGGGVLVERYEYGDYGQLVDAITLDPIVGDPSGFGNSYLFNGRRYDTDTRWYYYRTRYMDPQSGRFTTRDSAGLWGDSDNLGSAYAYVANCPFSNTDPDGRETNRQGSDSRSLACEPAHGEASPCKNKTCTFTIKWNITCKVSKNKKMIIDALTIEWTKQGATHTVGSECCEATRAPAETLKITSGTSNRLNEFEYVGETHKSQGPAVTSLTRKPMKKLVTPANKYSLKYENKVQCKCLHPEKKGKTPEHKWTTNIEFNKQYRCNVTVSKIALEGSLPDPVPGK